MSREIVIPKYATVILLLITTLAIVSITVWMAGKSYENFDPIPFDDLRYLAKRLAARPTSTHIVAVIALRLTGNVLLLVPWRFLAFITFYTVERPTLQTYVLTILLGFSFTLAIEGWQYFLPSRVADVNDVIWNTCGTIAGALLGHARLRVRLEFD